MIPYKITAASIFIFIALVAAIIFAPTASATDHNQTGLQNTSGQTIRIGAIYNLEGSQSPLDLPSAQGALLAVREINSQGGIDGRDLELILCDAKSNPAEVAECARILLEENISAIMGLSDTDMVLAAAPLTEEAGVPFVTSGATSPRLAQEYGMLFLACFGDDVQAAAGAVYAYNKMDLKTCTLLVDGNMEYARLLAGYFKERYQDLGGRIVIEAFLNRSDPQNLSREVKDAGSDMVYLASGPQEAKAVIEEMRSAGIGVPVFGGDSLDSPLLGREGMGRIVFTTHALLDENSSISGEFARTYREEYGNPPENAFSALGYDTVRLLAGAIDSSESSLPQAVLEALGNTTGFKGVTGEISYQMGRRIPDKDVTVILLDDGEMKGSEVVRPHSSI